MAIATKNLSREASSLFDEIKAFGEQKFAALPLTTWAVLISICALAVSAFIDSTANRKHPSEFTAFLVAVLGLVITFFLVKTGSGAVRTVIFPFYFTFVLAIGIWSTSTIVAVFGGVGLLFTLGAKLFSRWA